MTRRAPISPTLVLRAARRRYGSPLAWLRAMFVTLVLRHGSELCYDCGRRYGRTLWWAPEPLWREVMGGPGGLLCPACFDRRCQAHGIHLSWTPMVTGRRVDGELVPTTNWWLDETRDALLVGVPDPAALDRDIDALPPQQRTWAAVRHALEVHDA